MASTLGIYEKAQPDEVALEEKLETARAAGYDSFELSVDESDARLARLDWTDSRRAALLSAASDADPLGSADPAVVRRGMGILAKGPPIWLGQQALLHSPQLVILILQPVDSPQRQFLEPVALSRGVFAAEYPIESELSATHLQMATAQA